MEAAAAREVRSQRFRNNVLVDAKAQRGKNRGAATALKSNGKPKKKD